VSWRSGDDKGFYLNGQKTYLRGSNFALHRFLEDPDAGLLAWNEDWVRKLFTTYPRDYSWNVFRTSLGRMPNFWYDIADEEGFLIDDEFSYWSLLFAPKNPNKKRDVAHLEWSIVELEKEFTSWIQENWNHAAIAWWSASNETTDVKSREVIDRVRYLDTTRQWENGGWQSPHGSNDPIEDHPYVFSANFNPIMQMLGLASDSIEALERHNGEPRSPMNLAAITYPSWDHAYINNEYGWLWLNRDGSPTLLTEDVYAKFMPDDATADEYREAYAYLHAGLTGFWRTKRGYAGIQHFAYLGHSKPGNAFTSDNFVDIENLVMEPRWHEYHKNVWSPVTVYIDKWADDYKRGKSQKVPLLLINDLHDAAEGALRLFAADVDGDILSKSEPIPIRLEPLGQQTLKLKLVMPEQKEFVLYAELTSVEPGRFAMRDRRKFGLEHPGVIAENPKAISTSHQEANDE